MERSRIEPGVLQVFRWFAVLRIVLLGAALGITYLIPFERRGPPVDLPSLSVIPWALLENALLFAYLSWRRLHGTLGRWYLPLGITLAALGLQLEQFWISPFTRIWQPEALLFILLILVAWQYDFRWVVLFSLAINGLEFALETLFPQPVFFITRSGVPDNAILYGRLIARMFSFLVLGYVVTRLVAAQRAQRHDLAAANKKLVQHAATLEQLATSRERNRISRELHDTLAHTLSAQTVQLEAVMAVWEPAPPKAQEMLRQMLATARTGLEETRRALRALRASPLEDLGLAQALRLLAQDFTDRNSLALEMDIAEHIDDISPEVEQCYYRVAQEALENTARHANARLVRVALSQVNGSVTLTVSDDGRGLEEGEAENQRGLGIQGMRERAELIGASLELSSAPGKGTTVRLKKESA
jgi:signal transduction histidine kinase